MTHPTDRLSEYVDEELTVTERRELETHLTTCADCRKAADELREIVTRARSLRDVTPAIDLWPAVAERLEPRRPGLLHRFTATRLVSWQVTLSLPQLAAAAVLLVAVSAASMWLLQARRAPLTVVEVEPATPNTARVAVAANLADEPYESAVADLERVLRDGRDQLDPSTVDVLESNLAIIDRAIRDARAALAQDPSDLYLNGHLVAARQRKLEILRQAGALIMEGN